MIKSINHRGKDGAGFFCDGPIALVHARLSILDLSKKADQPYHSEKKDIALTYNGEIYNYQKINKQLQNNFIFRSSGDTETLLRSYQSWGMNMLSRFKGMWAFGIYDKPKKLLRLAVDRFGIKPLYYIDTDDYFAFSSEIKAFFCLSNFEPKLEKKNLGEYYIYRSIASNQTLFKEVKKMLPGTLLDYDIRNKKAKIKQYYKIKKITLSKNNSNIKKELVKRINCSIKEHLVSDAPIGLQLSGGLDSSLIASLAVKIKKNNFHSFSIGIKRPGWNEFKYSRLVAKKLKTIHHEIYFTEEDFCSRLPKLTYQMDEPINHLHSVPMNILSECARKHVKVLLSGEGADELFFGYTRYKKLFGNGLSDKKIIQSSQFVDKKIVKKITNIDTELINLFRKKVVKNINNPYDKLFKLDTLTYLLPLLIRQDKMGMAANIENRVPFLDHEIAEFAYSVPLKNKLSKNNAKIILKESAKDFLPVSIINRKKVGFGLPQSDWLRHKNGLGAYLEFFMNPEFQKRDFLNYPAVKKIINDHLEKKSDHGQILWILIALEIWLQIFIDNKDYSNIWKEVKNI